MRFSLVQSSLPHNFTKSFGHHSWLCNNNFLPSSIFSPSTFLVNLTLAHSLTLSSHLFLLSSYSFMCLVELYLLSQMTLSPVIGNSCPSWISGRRNENMWPDRLSNPGPLALESDVLLVLRWDMGFWLYQFLIISYRFHLKFKPIFWSFWTLKAPITTAADDIHKYIFSLFFRENKTWCFKWILC